MIIVSTNVYCDLCDETCTEGVEHHPTAREARRFARPYMKSFRHNGRLVDLCLGCAEGKTREELLAMVDAKETDNG